MSQALIQEIFSSIQGEGPWIGQRQIFVRFIGCDLKCRYCDTPSARSENTTEADPGECRAQVGPGSFSYEQISRGVAGTQLTKLCSRLRLPGPAKTVVSLTGGEPLLHEVFLSEWLPTVKQEYQIYLETNGVNDVAMGRLKDMVDIVSMDFKLPSATGMRPFWDEHKRFLNAARETALFVKAVITADTDQTDVIRAAHLLAGFDRRIPLILQPASGNLAPGCDLLLKMQNAALGVIGDVRVIPQAHKILQIP